MRFFVVLILSLLLISSLFVPSLSFADGKGEQVEASPKKGWGEFSVVEVEEPTLFGKIVLWLPNRVLDFIDIFRLDIGVGFSFGGVIRVSKYFQAGYRDMSPASFRLGNFGRKLPYMAEKTPEFGFSPFYSPSKQREVCPGEFGVGGDLLIGGAYGGICVEEAIDFIGGIFTFDIMDDDLRY